MSTLSEIRFKIERAAGKQITNDDVILWANQVNMDLGNEINVPDTGTISLTTDDLSYTLPIGLKIINHLWLQSDFDNGIDKEFTWPYRIYNGMIIFRQPWNTEETLNIDFYKHLTQFTAVTDTLDLDARFDPLYVFYGVAMAKEHDVQKDGNYQNMKQQVMTYYSLQNEPAIVEERW